MQRLEQAVVGLEQALSTPPRLHQSWRKIVKQRLKGVRTALASGRTTVDEPWLRPARRICIASATGC